MTCIGFVHPAYSIWASLLRVVSRLLHPWLGLVFSPVAMRFMIWRRDMHTTPEDRA